MWEQRRIKKTSYVYSNKLIFSQDNEEKRYYISDHLGSTSVVLDEDNEIVEENEYYDFGNLKNHEGEENSKYKYTGKEFDEESGLYNYGARFYNPEVGRFITADTIKGKIENPQTLNRYAYTLNNPMKYVDPDGHEVIVVINWDLVKKYMPEFKKAFKEATKTKYYKTLEDSKNKYLIRLAHLEKKKDEKESENEIHGRKGWLAVTRPLENDFVKAEIVFTVVDSSKNFKQYSQKGVKEANKLDFLFTAVHEFVHASHIDDGSATIENTQGVERAMEELRTEIEVLHFARDNIKNEEFMNSYTKERFDMMDKHVKEITQYVNEEQRKFHEKMMMERYKR